MGRTRLQIRLATARQFGLPVVAATGSANTTTTVTDVDALGIFSDDALVGQYAYMAAASFPDRLISSNVQSTGVITFQPASAADNTYEILPFRADAIHEAIDQALLILYDSGDLVRKLWFHAVSGSPIYNADMSYWTSTSTLDGWTVASSTLLRSQAAADKWIGEESADISTSSGTLTLDRKYSRYLADLAPGGVRLHAWLYANASSAGRIRLLENGSSVAASDSVEGDSDWHVVSTSDTALTDGETDISVQIELQTNDTVNVDLIWLSGGNYPDLHPFPLALMPDGPSEIFRSPIGWDEGNLRAQVLPTNLQPVSGWEIFRFHDEGQTVETGLIRWGKSQKPPAEQLLWIVGNGPFTLPTTDSAVLTGIVEIDQREEMLLAKTAALILLENQGLASGRAWADRAGRLQRDIEVLREGHGGDADSVALGITW